MHVLFDTSPLKSGHSHRGIGIYTALLSQELKKLSNITLSFSVEEARKKEETLDLVHYPFFDLFFPTLPLLKPATKSVVTIHDVIPLQFKTQYPVGKKGKLAHFFQRLALRQVNAVITDSISSQQAIEKYLHIPASKISVVYLAGNPLLQAKSEKVIANLKEKYNLPDKYLLYVGDINYNKNLPQLIKTLKYLEEDIHLVLFGKNFIPQQIPEWQWLETQIALSDVATRVHFITKLSADIDTELSALYSGALVYVQPSLAEGFGLPVLEAFQCKVPVVTSNTTSLPEVGGSVAFYSEPEAESFALAVKKILSLSGTERKRLVDRASQWAESFTWKKTAESTLKVYEKLL